MGRYASFAAGFSFISVLTTVFQFFSLGYSFGGPGFFWTWPVVLVGQFLVAACFAELAARMPISGAIYQWASRLGTPAFGWYAGWIMVIGRIVVVAAAALALQVVLPAVWPGFQLVGGDPSPPTTSGAANAAVLGLLALTTLLNVLDNRALRLAPCGRHLRRPRPLRITYPALPLAPSSLARPAGHEGTLTALRALAAAPRLQVMVHLANRSRSTKELTTLLGLFPSVISRHSHQLTQAGLTATRREGCYVLYASVPDRLDLIATALISLVLRPED